MFIPPGYANLQVLFELPDNSEGMTALGFEVTSFDPVADLDAVDEATHDWAWMAQMATETDYLGVRVILGTSGDPLVFESRAHGQVGGGGNGLPPNTSVLITKRTALGGRKGRGRMFLPGVRETMVGGRGEISPTDVTAITDDVQNWVDELTPLFGGDPVLFHTLEADTPTAITTFQCESLVATQRRRMHR